MANDYTVRVRQAIENSRANKRDQSGLGRWGGILFNLFSNPWHEAYPDYGGRAVWEAAVEQADWLPCPKLVSSVFQAQIPGMSSSLKLEGLKADSDGWVLIPNPDNPQPAPPSGEKQLEITLEEAPPRGLYLRDESGSGNWMLYVFGSKGCRMEHSTIVLGADEERSSVEVVRSIGPGDPIPYYTRHQLPGNLVDRIWEEWQQRHRQPRPITRNDALNLVQYLTGRRVRVRLKEALELGFKYARIENTAL